MDSRRNNSDHVIGLTAAAMLLLGFFLPWFEVKGSQLFGFKSGSIGISQLIESTWETDFFLISLIYFLIPVSMILFIILRTAGYGKQRKGEVVCVSLGVFFPLLNLVLFFAGLSAISQLSQARRGRSDLGNVLGDLDVDLADMGGMRIGMILMMLGSLVLIGEMLYYMSRTGADPAPKAQALIKGILSGLVFALLIYGWVELIMAGFKGDVLDTSNANAVMIGFIFLLFALFITAIAGSMLLHRHMDGGGSIGYERALGTGMTAAASGGFFLFLIILLGAPSRFGSLISGSQIIWWTAVWSLLGFIIASIAAAAIGREQADAGVLNSGSEENGLLYHSEASRQLAAKSGDPERDRDRTEGIQYFTEKDTSADAPSIIKPLDSKKIIPKDSVSSGIQYFAKQESPDEHNAGNEMIARVEPKTEPEQIRIAEIQKTETRADIPLLEDTPVRFPRKKRVRRLLLLSGFILLTGGAVTAGWLTNWFGLVQAETAGQQAAPAIVRATVDGLRVRQEPGMQAAVVDGLAEGEAAHYGGQQSAYTETQFLRDQQVTAPWYRIRTQRGTEGWVFGGGIRMEPAGSPLSYPAVIQDPDGYTNVRNGPGTQHQVIEQVYNSQVFQVLSQAGEWWKVQTPGGRTGFMHRSRVRMQGNFPGSFPQASMRILSADELRTYSKETLRLMRNEIFARHGFVFGKDDLKVYFGQQPWYQPCCQDVTDKLSMLERENIRMILEMER
ncbi:MAG: SH3 domain-containing protein [Bacteroidia bacterium]|nr:SH3 domain-containing protein [Bacteroidia bacterium]